METMPPPRPIPFYKPPYQSGISDPHWPVGRQDYPDDASHVAHAGRVDPQKFLSIVRANVSVEDRAQLKDLFIGLTRVCRDYMEREPSRSHLMPLAFADVPSTYRVTVTLGLGTTLFVDQSGFDRFGIRAFKPAFLKRMPKFPGDGPNFDIGRSESDLIFMICSDHPYVNTAIARDLCERFSQRFAEKNALRKERRYLKALSVEQGFGRPDKREFLRFDDGIDNIRVGQELEKLVYVAKGDNEPEWCSGGSYMVYRKIREVLPVWEAFQTNEQEAMIGRRKDSGAPLSRATCGSDRLTPVFPNHKDPADGPLNAHIRKVQPRRSGFDLFGIADLDRRFLRRPYPFFDGLNNDGAGVNGLHFIAFMRSIQQQFEHVTNMWQMNPDFPTAGTGIDAMYARGVLQTIDGGYYFCPPAPANEKDYLCSALFEEGVA